VANAAKGRKTMAIRVLLIDDHPVVRAGLRAVLDAELDLEVVGEARHGVTGIGLARTLRPNVVVTDLLLPDMDAVCMTQSIRAELPNTRVVILTAVDEADGSVVRAVQAGAIAYVLKSTETEQLVRTIRSAAEGQLQLSPRAAARLIQEVRGSTSQLALTDREREVLRELAVGRSNKEIARALCVAETTVKSHVRAILDKLGVRSRTQAASLALRTRLVPLAA
jgi:DNA-binding NarL/FixJ family response regulator